MISLVLISEHTRSLSWKHIIFFEWYPFNYWRAILTISDIFFKSLCVLTIDLHLHLLYRKCTIQFALKAPPIICMSRREMDDEGLPWSSLKRKWLYVYLVAHLHHSMSLHYPDQQSFVFELPICLYIVPSMTCLAEIIIFPSQLDNYFSISIRSFSLTLKKWHEMFL
jgi:hypothetical protein